MYYAYFNMDESQNNYSEWKISDQKRVRIVCFKMDKIPESAN